MSFLTDKLTSFKTLLKKKRAKHFLKVSGAARFGLRGTMVDGMFAKKNKDYFMAQDMVECLEDPGNTDLDTVKIRQLDYWKIRLNLFDDAPASPIPTEPDMNSSDALIVHYCGLFDASLNLFPTVGGTGVGTAINLGDQFKAATAGVLKDSDETPYPMPVGMMCQALVKNPGQLGANWRIF